MRNYQKELDSLIESFGGERPRLLLHSCCGPCSTYCLEYLSKNFDITVYYYNPNIEPAQEYFLRLSEQKKVIETLPFESGVSLIEGEYEPVKYIEFVTGLEGEHEGGTRCEKCFRMRLEKTAQVAKEHGFAFFGTTLTVSPHKNAAIINSIGEEISVDYGVKFLPSDFKKKGGYLRSTQLSKEYDIYRQNYCGCRFARSEGENNV